MQSHKLSALLNQGPKEISVRGERQTGEIRLEELSVAAAVGGRMEDSVGIIEDILGAEVGIEVACAILNKVQSQPFRDVIDELPAQVGATASLKLHLASAWIQVRRGDKGIV